MKVLNYVAFQCLRSAHTRAAHSLARVVCVCVCVCALALAHYIMRHEFIKRDFAFMFLRKMHRENDINTLLGIYMRARARALRPGCCARARARAREVLMCVRVCACARRI